MPAFASEAVASEVEDVKHRERLLDTRSAVFLGFVLAWAALGIFALGRYTDVDLVLADVLYDGVMRAFPWRDAWLTASFSHRIAKTALTIAAALFIAVAVGDLIWPQPVFNRPLARLRLRIVAWSALLVPVVISLLKQSSNAHCPWDLARYGGAEPYLRLFEALPPGIAPGHCMPAGHASSGLWLLSLAVFSLPGSVRQAWRALGFWMVPGLGLGWMQQMRGAHFLTHTLWSAWIACAIVLALAMLLQAGTVENLYSRVRLLRRAGGSS